MLLQNQAATNRQNLREVTIEPHVRANLRFQGERNPARHQVVQVYLEVEIKIRTAQVLQKGQVPAEERAAAQYQVRIVTAAAVVAVAVAVAVSRTTQKVLANQKGDKT